MNHSKHHNSISTLTKCRTAPSRQFRCISENGRLLSQCQEPRGTKWSQHLSVLTTCIPPGPPLIKSRQHPPMELFTHTHWPTEHLIALYNDKHQPRGVNGWMPVDLWSTFRDGMLGSHLLCPTSRPRSTGKYNLSNRKEIYKCKKKTAGCCLFYIFRNI